MKYGEYDVTVGDGKYRWKADGDGSLEATRHGAPWPGGQVHLEQQKHSKSWTALMMETQEARDALYLIGKLFTVREIAAACERRGIPTGEIEESYSLDMIKVALMRAEAGRG